jgi:hypothetical protein
MSVLSGVAVFAASVFVGAAHSKSKIVNGGIKKRFFIFSSL